jgi:RNA polymerase sigma-70 factor (ECF subfamily)
MVNGSTDVPGVCRALHSQGDSLSAASCVASRAQADAAGMGAPMTFHELYGHYAADVYRFAHWLTGNPDDARDITSETFVRVWTAGKAPRAESVKAYLFAIARNLHRKRWRRESRQQELEESMPDPAASPDRAAMNREEFQEAMRAIQALPELDRTVLLLRAEELSYEDIAAVTGLSVAAARVKTFRARAKLAAMLKS